MRYYIGIDGGGTKSVCVIADEHKKQLHECTGGPTSFLTMGVEPVSETIFGLIAECIEKLSIHYNQIEAVFVGSTGAGRRLDAQQLEAGIRAVAQKRNANLKNIFVDSDALAALEGAFSGNPGSILISGTGSIMYGKDEKDKLYRVGGFGRFIGDEGSAYHMGKRALNTVARQLDGRSEPTLITNLLQKEFHILTQDDLITQIYRNHFDIASVARLVFQAADQGDLQARKIISEELEELLSHIRTMEKKIGVQNLEVSLIGSMIAKDNVFSRMLREKIKTVFPNVRLKEAKCSPAFGAVLLAQKRMNALSN